MKHATQVELLERLLGHIERDESDWGERDTRVDAKRYTSSEREAQERETAFRQAPLVLGHASQIAQPHDALTLTVLGRSVSILRDKEGVARAFLNVCRHRGTQLLSEGKKENCKGLVCPYHGWTYDLAGKLIHIPEESAFPGVDKSQFGLVELELEERFGLLWLSLAEDTSVDTHISERFRDDLTAFALEEHVIYRKARMRKACNWKLIMDAFLEGYHIRQLHRHSLYRFFKGNVHFHDLDGSVLRVVSSRVDTRDILSKTPRSEWNIRNAATSYFMFFPNTVLLFHPTYVSLLRAWPDGPGHCIYDHELLIPTEQNTPEMEAHWAKSFELVENQVFQREDLAAAESIQAGFASGANTELVFGRLENMLQWFHTSLDQSLSGCR